MDETLDSPDKGSYAAYKAQEFLGNKMTLITADLKNLGLKEVLTLLSVAGAVASFSHFMATGESTSLAAGMALVAGSSLPHLSTS